MPTSKAGSCNRRTGGFTLAETMVVLLIVSALAVLVLPSLTPLLGGQDFRTAAGRLGEAFARARLDAVIDGTPRRLGIDLEAGRIRVYRIPPNTAVGGALDKHKCPVTSGRVVVRVLPLGLSEPCLLVLADASNSEKSLDIASTGEPVWRDAATTTTIDRRTP